MPAKKTPKNASAGTAVKHTLKEPVPGVRIAMQQ